jgi:exopolysaccharide production protein ExoQ
MNPQIATAAYLILIAGLFWLDRGRKIETSRALWIPTVWLLIIASRPVSLWLEPARQVTQVTGESLEGSPVDATVFGILLLAALAVLAARRRRTVSFLRANTPVLLFFVYCGISVFWSDYSFIAFKRWIKAIGDLAMVLLIVTDLNPTAALRRVLSRMAFVLLPLSVLLIKYYPEFGRTYNPWTWSPQYGGVTMFKNLLGETCLVAGLGSVWSLTVVLRNRKELHRLRRLGCHAIVIAMALYLCLTADSMTSFSCLMFGGILIVLTSIGQIRRRPAAVHLLVTFLIVIALCAVFLPAANLVQSLGRDSTLTGRTAIWAAAISVASSPVGGAGFESFWTGDRVRKIWALINEPGIQEAHNGYLEVYLNLGWIGVILLGVLIVSGYRNVMRLFRRDREAGMIRLAYFVVALVFSFTEAGFRMMSVAWMAFLIATLAFPPSKQSKKHSGAPAGNDLARPVPAESSAVWEDALEAI